MSGTSRGLQTAPEAAAQVSSIHNAEAIPPHLWAAFRAIGESGLRGVVHATATDLGLDELAQQTSQNARNQHGEAQPGQIATHVALIQLELSHEGSVYTVANRVAELTPPQEPVRVTPPKPQLRLVEASEPATPLRYPRLVYSSDERVIKPADRIKQYLARFRSSQPHLTLVASSSTEHMQDQASKLLF